MSAEQPWAFCPFCESSATRREASSVYRCLACARTFGVDAASHLTERALSEAGRIVTELVPEAAGPGGRALRALVAIGWARGRADALTDELATLTEHGPGAG